MENTVTESQYAVIDRYIIPADSIFPLCSESLLFFFKRITGSVITEAELIECLANLGYSPLLRNGKPWSGAGVPAWFRLRFVRDDATRGLFDYLDSSLCGSHCLSFVISNATLNRDKRMRDFCQSIVRTPNLCHRDVTDADVTEYLRWVSRHAPSSKSAFAATLLYYMSDDHEWIDHNLSPEQLQFIRENPNLKLTTTPC